MFIKLIRLDNTPIWLNASFIVTVEPRRGGGSIVVPVGDGLDYEVRESPDVVLEMLADVPAPAVVPIPSGDCLAKPPTEAAPEPVASTPLPVLAPAEPAPAKKVRKTRAKAKAVEVSAEAKPDETTEVKVEEKPEKPKATRKRKAKAVEPPPEKAEDATPPPPEAAPATRAEASAAFAAAAPAPEPAVPAPAVEAVQPEMSFSEPASEPVAVPIPFDDDQLERLRKLTPRTIQRLKNTLAAQFKVCDHESAINALVHYGIITLAPQGRIIWK